MADIKKLLGKRIKFYREQKNLTQEEFAEKIGINSRSVSLIERGTNFVSAKTLELISLSLGVSLKNLFDFDQEYNEKQDYKEKLLSLLDKNEDKIYVIYKIVKGYLD